VGSTFKQQYPGIATFVLALYCCLGIGCSSQPDELAVFPVKGVLVYKGQPLENALLTFHPVDRADPRRTAARATTTKEGKFELSTRNANDGAAEGEYTVTVECYKLVGSKGSWEPGPNILPPKYSSPQSSDLKVSVKKDDSAEKRIEIR
jgi:hypothetical protein